VITQSTKNTKKSLNPTELDLSYPALPNSKKIYVSGNIFSDIRVPFREISLSPTFNSEQRKIENPPLRLYDTSGPYADLSVKINIAKGLAELRKSWILQRGDTDTLPDFSSRYQRERVSSENRFPVIKKPLKAKPGRNTLRFARVSRRNLSVLK
jgi:phosphomethylpyrimidine synthase